MDKVIVAGTRYFNNYDLMCKKLDYFLCNLEGIEIVSGTARGADALVEQYANEHDLPTKQFPADWDK